MPVLIIEDEQKTAKYLSQGLKSHGYSVVSAQDGEEGLYLAREHQFDLIILDIMLPKIICIADLEIDLLRLKAKRGKSYIDFTMLRQKTRKYSFIVMVMPL